MHACIDLETIVLGHFGPLVPGQRTAQFFWQVERRCALTGMPRSVSSCPGPIPERSRMAGELMAPGWKSDPCCRSYSYEGRTLADWSAARIATERSEHQPSRWLVRTREERLIDYATRSTFASALTAGPRPRATFQDSLRISIEPRTRSPGPCTALPPPRPDYRLRVQRLKPPDLLQPRRLLSPDYLQLLQLGNSTNVRRVGMIVAHSRPLEAT